MGTYGSIPTSGGGSGSGSGSGSVEFISQAKERARTALATRRPWKVMLDWHAVGIPHAFGEALVRIRTNIAYFRMNYAMVVLLVIFLSLLWNPISLIVFIVMMAAWLFLYFLRDEPLVVFNRTINDRLVLIVLAVLTLIFLLLTKATSKVLISLAVGVVVVLLHAAFRKTDDLFLDQEARPGGGMYSVVVDSSKRPLNEPSTSS